MPLLYYMDVHIPAAITAGLRRRGIDVLTSQEDQTRRAADEALLRRATELDRLLFSQDSDLLQLARRWQTEGQIFAGLVFAHEERTSIGRCIDDLELIAQSCSRDEVVNQVIFIPLRSASPVHAHPHA
jgi:predicted nuclease of predicted toxin-antitoxin system